MDKTAIKNFAVEARKMLRDSAIFKAGSYGITEDGCTEPVQTGNGFEVYKTIAGTDNRIFGDTIKKRSNLVRAIDQKGFDNVIEEVAYTWFNRLIAIRFMEVNDYLPTRVRVLSSENSDKKEPDIVTQSLDVDLNMSEEELSEVQKAKDENRYDDAFAMLFIKQCNELNDILPGLFEKTDDYMELLLKLSYTNDGVVRMLVDTVPEENFDVEKEGQVEIIGWLYQYYNTEPKAIVDAYVKKGKKVTKEDLPAKTQLFTPDWIVCYMVENSLGRLWIEHLRANDPSLNEKQLAEEFGWKYYLPEAKQEDSVNIKLAEIRTSYKDMTPMDIKCIDPCMGSGHILVYMFDVLMDIYRSAGYSERDSVFYILENNIRGLDIDQRAYQLSYFALMMKGRRYNRRFFAGREVEQEGRSWRKYPSPDVRAIKESNILPDDLVNQIKENFTGVFNDNELKCIQYVMDVFKDAKECGSILNVDNEPDNETRQYASVVLKLNSMIGGTHPICMENNLDFIQRLIIIEQLPLLNELLIQACVMSKKYDVVITNPPYMGSSMNSKISNFLKKKFPDSKSDLFAVFIEKCGQMLQNYGYQAMITQHTWMFLSSFENLRNKLMKKYTINMAHLGARAFEEIGGDVVQTTSFVIRNAHINDFIGTYCRLVEPTTQHGKEKMFLDEENRYIINQSKFSKIPGTPVAYWVDEKVILNYECCNLLGDIAYVKKGMFTGKNDMFFRNWYEVNWNSIDFGVNNKEQIQENHYVPMNSGGTFRRWYGNRLSVIKFDKKHYDIITQNKGHRNPQFYFQKAASWTKITSGKFSIRLTEAGFINNDASMAIFENNVGLETIVGLLNSKVAQYYLRLVNESLNYTSGNVASVPYKITDSQKISNLVYNCVNYSRYDWDLFEVSWDFKRHPLIGTYTTIQEAYSVWSENSQQRFYTLKKTEEELNKILIDEYSLQDKLKPDVEDKDITIHKADLERDIKSLISYSVGCMLGRYSLDVEGLAYAGGEWDNSKYKTFIPDADNIIPITDEEYFDDDIVCRFVDFVKIVYGEDTLEENLEFIANGLGGKGKSSREIIKNYFIKDFYKDHCKIYKKRPIYWLFDSGKQNGFKVLIYMHRYDKDTVGRIRTNYLHKTQNAIEGALKNAEYIISSSTSAVDKAKATKDRDKYIKQLNEIKIYDQALAHVALKRIDIDLDDGVKHNYQLFQGVEISSEGEDTKKKKVSLLAKI